MSEAISVEELLDLGERVLADSTHIFDDHDNRTEAEELLAHTLDVDPDDLKDLNDDLELSKRQRERYLSLVARRAGGEPTPFLLGSIEFWGLDLKVRPGAFVPRPSSELVVERALKRLKSLKSKDKAVVVDVCTGAGPIALAVADELPSAEVWAADISEEGLNQGRSNARSLGIPNVRFKSSDMYSSLPARLAGRVDVITGHVPYVPPDEVDDLPSEVKEHEPLYTLTDESDDGLTLMRRAIDEASGWLKPGGWLLLEVSEDIAPKLRRLAAKAGLEDRGIASDSDRLSVVVEARRSRKNAKNNAGRGNKDGAR